MRCCFLLAGVLLLGATDCAWSRPHPSWPRKFHLDIHGDPLPAGAISRLGTYRFRHSNPLTSLVFSPDGKRLISADTMGDVSVWDVNDGRETRRWHDLENKKQHVGFSPDGRLMARTKSDFTYEIVDLETDKQVDWHAHEPPAKARFAFSHDNKLIASPSGIREIGTGKELRPLVNCSGPMLFLRGTNTLAYVGNGISLLEATTKKQVRSFGSAGDCLAVSPDGKLTASRVSNHLQLYDTATGKEIRQMQPREGGICSIVFSPDGKMVVTGDGATHILLWNAYTGDLLGQLDGHVDWVTCLAFSPDGQYLASGSLDHTVRIWDVKKRKEIHQMDTHQAGYLTAQFLNDGKTLATWCNQGYPSWTREGAIIRFWDHASGKKKKQLTWKHGPGAPFWWGKPFIMSLDARHFALGEQTGKVHLKNLIDDKEVGVLEHGGTDMIGFMQLSRDNQLLAVHTNRGGAKSLHVWNMAEKKKLWFDNQPDGNRRSEFSADGKILSSLVTLKDHAVLRFRMARTGKVLPQQVKLAGEWNWAWSPNSRLIASPGLVANPLVLHELASGQEVQILKGSPPGVNSLAFSPDGRVLAVGHVHGLICIWDLQAGKELGRFHGHRGDVMSLSFSPDGKELASAAKDATILVWDCRPLLARRTLELKPLADQEFQTMWLALKTGDPTPAYRAMSRLLQSPADTVSLLQKQIAVAKPPDPQLLARLIYELDSNRFEVRQRASAELEKLGDLAGPALEAALKTNPSLETRRRVERLLRKLEDPGLSPDWLQKVRALEALEYLGTSEARAFLERLANGAPGARLTQEARLTLDRWKQ